MLSLSLYLKSLITLFLHFLWPWEMTQCLCDVTSEANGTDIVTEPTLPSKGYLTVSTTVLQRSVK